MILDNTVNMYIGLNNMVFESASFTISLKIPPDFIINEKENTCIEHTFQWIPICKHTIHRFSRKEKLQLRLTWKLLKDRRGSKLS